MVLLSSPPSLIKLSFPKTKEKMGPHAFDGDVLLGF